MTNPLPPALTHLAALAILGFGLSACAPDASAPQASAPPPSQTALGANPAPSSAAAGSGGMAGMNHANMPGMARSGASGGGIAGMDHSNMQGMGGMNMQQMMAHCRQMRADAARGVPPSPDMQAMMAHCDMMGGTQPAAGAPRAR